MNTIALICGIAGGLWAIVAGFWALLVVILPAGSVARTNWFLLVVLIFILLMGVLSEVAIALRTRKPRLALILIKVSIVGLFIMNFLDPGVLPLLVLPAAILLVPAFIKMSRGIVKTQG